MSKEALSSGFRLGNNEMGAEDWVWQLGVLEGGKACINHLSQTIDKCKIREKYQDELGFAE